MGSSRRSLPAGLKALFSPHRRGEEPADALGIPWRFHYSILSISSVNLSLPPLLVSFSEKGAELTHPWIRMSCVFGLCMAPFFVTMGRRWKWEFKYGFFVFAVMVGTVSLSISGFVLDELTAPMMASLLVSPIGAAYYFKPHHAYAYIPVSAMIVVGFGLEAGGTRPFIQGLFLATVMICGGSMLVALRRHLIEVVQRNQAMSELDALTGAANVRCFERRLAEEIARHDRGGRPFALIGIDLDDFKQVNDSFSHTLGDEVLAASADAMRAAVHEGDLLVRRGGDEFMIVVPASDTRDLGVIVHEIARNVAQARYSLCDEVLPTATAVWVQHDQQEAAAELIQRVDDALHDVKENAPSTRRGTVTREEVEVIIDEIVELYGIEPRVGDVGADAAEIEVVVEQSEDPMLGARRLAWRTAALATWGFSFISLALAAAGIERQAFTPLTISMMIFSIVVLAPAFWSMSRRDIESERFVHLLAAGAITVTTTSCAAVTDIGPYAAEMFLMSILVIPALLPRRQAMGYCLAAAIGYVGFIVGNGYHPAQMRINTSLINISVLAMIVGVTRGRTVVAAAEAASLAKIDALTGLPNLRRLRARLDDEIRRCTASGDTFGLLMFDLDAFKSVNDIYSHTTGDRVLVEVAKALDATARHADMPARRGGDEFALVLTDCDAAGAAAAAERVNDAVVEVRLLTCPDVQPTASVGWVVWEAGESTDDLLARVDLSLHAQKVISHEQRARIATIA